MVAEAPHLSHADLEAELGLFHAREHRTLHTAFYGTGDAGTVTAKVRGEARQFSVRPVACELRLREALAEARNDGDPLVLLVDYTERLPLDVQGRLAQGVLQYISRERRLANLFGARAVAPALLSGPLSNALLRDGRRFTTALEGTTVDEHRAWRLQLQRMTGLDPQPELSEERVIEHFAREEPRPALGRDRETDPELFAAACEYLRKSAGPIAELAFARWLDGRGREVAALSFLIEPLAERMSDGYVLAFLQGELKQLAKGLLPSAELLTRWKALVPALGLRLQNHSTLFERVLAEADARVAGYPGLLPHLLESRFVASGFEAAKQALARAFDAIAAQARVGVVVLVRLENLRAAIDAEKRLRHHRLASTEAQKVTVERATMAVRLAAYLHANGDWQTQLAGRAPAEVACELAVHYASEGGFIDFARRAARGPVHDDPLSAAIDRVLAVADAVRDVQDAVFAPALKRWNTERKRGRLTPIENALEAFGLDFVLERDHRRLLILLMDGMAWSTAVEILLDVRELKYGPLRWKPQHANGAQLAAPMIAALPTMTEVSRAALFAGKLPKVGEKLDTTRDPERLAAHRAFTKALGHGPRLLLRTHAEDNAGHLTKDARALVASSDRVVALVLNAVDDMLGAKPSYRGAYNRETIKALQPVLEEARKAGRAVLLLADHGHVLSDRKRKPIKVEGADSPRYRELSTTAAVEPGELVIDAEDPNAYRTRAGQRLALLFQESDRYKDVHHLGEHGGASMAEVVTPALLIGADELERAVADDEDESLQTVALAIPAWWNLELSTAPASIAAPSGKRSDRPAPGEGGRKKKISNSQLPIFEEPKQPARPVSAHPPATAQRALSEWAVRVDAAYAGDAKSRRDLLHRRVLPMLELLLDHEGRMSDDVFAGKVGEALRNVGALVAMMGEFLNVDEYAVVRHNAGAKQVELDLPLLRELFGGKA